jgi:hypothetical protein
MPSVPILPMWVVITTKPGTVPEGVGVIMSGPVSPAVEPVSTLVTGAGDTRHQYW